MDLSFLDDDFLATWKLIQLNKTFDESWIMSFKWLKVGWENDKSWSSNHASCKTDVLSYVSVLTLNVSPRSVSVSVKRDTEAVIVLGKSDDYFFWSQGFSWGFSFAVHKKGEKEPIAQSLHSKMWWRSVNVETKLVAGDYVVKVRYQKV